MMATMKSYYKITYCTMCGLPAVTLLGERADWELIVAKANDLLKYDDKQGSMAKWHSFLKPVLDPFVQSFDVENNDESKRKETTDFWQRIAHYGPDGSGARYLSGWITAFCYFDEKGKPLYREGPDWKDRFHEGLILDGVTYHRVDIAEIPPGYGEVDVELRDGYTGNKWDMKLFAGSFGYRAYAGHHMHQLHKKERVEQDALKRKSVEALRQKNPPMPQGRGSMNKKPCECCNDGRCNQALHDTDDDGRPHDTLQPFCGWWLVKKADPGEKRDPIAAFMSRING
jgi:hypothetical protein